MPSGPRLQVTQDVRSQIPAVVRRAWMRGVTRAARRLGISSARLQTLSIRVVGDAEMERFHLRYMNEGGPTDVLSFPAEALPGTPEEVQPLGDLIVDWDAVLRQAAQPTLQAWCQEATALCVHGLVHLLGHDHRTRTEARTMLRLETRASRSASLPPVLRPYAK